MRRQPASGQRIPPIPAGVISEIAFAVLIGLSGTLICAILSWIGGRL